AAARADAPGAQRLLAKTPPRERHGVGKVAHVDRASTGPLHLGHGQYPLTTSNHHLAVANLDDRARIDTFRDRYQPIPSRTQLAVGRAHGMRGENPQLGAIEQGLGDWPGIERAHLPLERRRTVRPVDTPLALADSRRIGGPLGGLRHALQRSVL